MSPAANRPEQPKIGVLIRAAMFAAATAALAYVAFPLPFSPVPITGQSFGAMIAGLLLPPRAAMASQLAYLLAGAVGLPVYAGGRAGLGILLGPTGGYLWGLVAGSYITSAMVESSARRTRIPMTSRCIAASIIGGVVVLYALGVIQLALTARLGWLQALVVGALPYLPGDVVKASVAGIAGARLMRYR
ncbi:MAG TPA: biotin transporter BioY [Bacillota bacterium]|nr:biotin transporter BioY [Bacillota bacterium]